MAPKKPSPRRGDLWWATVSGSEARGKEFRDTDEGKPHLYLVMSENQLAQFGVVVAVPATSSGEGRPEALRRYEVAIEPRDVQPPPGGAGLTAPTRLQCEQVRVMAIERLAELAGKLRGERVVDVEDRLATVLRLARE